MERQLKRDQRSTKLSQSDTVIAGPNPRRYAILIDAPPPNTSGQLAKGAVGTALSGATTGIKLNYTVSAGVQGYLTSVTFAVTAGTPPTVALQLVRATVTYNLILSLASGVNSISMSLQAGDVIQLNVTTLQAASTFDATINATEDQGIQKVTISFNGPATLDNGHNLYGGGTPLILTHDHIGQAIREDIHAIAANGTPTITVTDVFEDGCTCTDPQYQPASPTGKLMGRTH